LSLVGKRGLAKRNPAPYCEKQADLALQEKLSPIRRFFFRSLCGLATTALQRSGRLIAGH
jgi:hypothetical protein